MILAQDYNIKTILKLSNVDYIYDKDPNSNPDAKAFKKISWQEYRAMVGDVWMPGEHVPFDPIASKLASEKSLRVLYVNGKNLDNAKKAMDREDFVGTVIE